jgi:hypothetical protein
MVNISLIPVDASVPAIGLQGNPMPPKPAASSAINSGILVRLVAVGARSTSPSISAGLFVDRR